MAVPLAKSLEGMIDNKTLGEVSVEQKELLNKMEKMNEQLEQFNVESEAKIAAAQAICTSYVGAMKNISIDIQNIFTRVRTLQKLLHQKYPTLCPDAESARPE